MSDIRVPVYGEPPRAHITDEMAREIVARGMMGTRQQWTQAGLSGADEAYLDALKQQYSTECAVNFTLRNKIDRLANSLRAIVDGVIILKANPGTIESARALLQELGK
jgi:hypothetical protein